MNKTSKSYIPDWAKNNHAFSLVELLVVMVLIGLIVAFVSSVYLFAERSLQQWRDNIQLENELHTLLNGISENIYKASAVEKVKKANLKVRMSPESGFNYSLENQQLMRNGKSLLEDGLLVTTLSFSSDKPTSSLVNPLQNQKVKQNIQIIRIRMALTDGRDTLQSSRSVYLRTPPGWQPLKSK